MLALGFKNEHTIIVLALLVAVISMLLINRSRKLTPDKLLTYFNYQLLLYQSQQVFILTA